MNDAGPLRIMFVIGSFGQGGAEGQLCRLAVELHQRGHHVTAVAMSDGGPLTEKLLTAGVSHHILGRPASSRLKAVGVTLRALYRLLRLMRSERPDVCHAWLWWAYVLALPVAAICRVPVRIAALRALRQPAEASILRRLLSLPAVLMMHAVTANSVAVADEAFAHRTVRRPTPIRVIHNGVDVPAWSAHPESDPPVAVCVANLIAYKGHRIALEALSQLDDPPRLTLVGTGPEAEQLRGLASALNLTGCVTFVGAASDPATYTRVAQLAILPSLTEGFPNAVLEAMAAGLPIIASRVGGIPELVTDYCGILVEPGSVTELAEAIRKLGLDAALRTQLGAAARTRAHQFDWGKCASLHEDLYRELRTHST